MCDGARYRAFQYDTETYDGVSHRTNVLWLQEPDNTVSWQGRWSTPTQWHGSFVQEGDLLIIMFDCQGRTDRLKSVSLLPTEPGQWRGVDYAGRRITLTLLITFDNPGRASHWQWAGPA